MWMDYVTFPSTHQDKDHESKNRSLLQQRWTKHCYIQNSWHVHVEHVEFGAYLHFFYFIYLIWHRNRYQQHYVMCKDHSFSLIAKEKCNSN